jgi:hypothetical protein
VTVAYTPTTRGDTSATLRFRADTPRDPVREVSLSGTGVAPGISVDPSSLQFGDTDLGDSPNETVEIENTGNRELRITTESMGEGFSRSETGTITIASGDTETIDVTFEPEEAGTYGSLLSLSPNDPFNDTVEVRASGTGLGGELLTSPNGELAFGEVTQGSTERASVLNATTVGTLDA